MPPTSPKSAVSPKTTKTAKTAKTAKAAAAPRPSAEVRRVADLLKQVSDPTRLQVLMLLNEKERNVSELCAELGTQSQPAVSHHLALLRHGRLIEPRRSGKHNFYGLTDAGRELARVVNSVVG
jgi:DNA-binding transcriptional ArsR family regulator